MPPLLLPLVLVGAIAVLLLIPTRRLYLAGWSQRVLLVYFLAMLGLGLLVAELRGPARFLVPILVIAYIAPFVVASDGMARLMGREPRRPVVRDVTPPPSLIEGSASRADEVSDETGLGAQGTETGQGADEDGDRATSPDTGGGDGPPTDRHDAGA